jgi:hypothetical protein
MPMRTRACLCSGPVQPSVPSTQGYFHSPALRAHV